MRRTHAQVVDAEAEELMERMEELGTLAKSGAAASRLPTEDGSGAGGDGARADLWRSSRYASQVRGIVRMRGSCVPLTTHALSQPSSAD